jgi:hypothetical protein
VQSGGKLWLQGTSTIHEFKGDASKLTIALHDDTAKWPADKTGPDAIQGLILANGVTGMDVVVGVTGLHSGKDGLDKNMYKALKAEQNPTIRFRMQHYAVTSPAAAETLAMRIDGTLTIAGTEKSVSLVARAWKGEKGEWVDGTQTLNMSEYGIKPPTMMMGAIKVADRVDIHYHLLLAPGAGALGTQVKTEK